MRKSTSRTQWLLPLEKSWSLRASCWQKREPCGGILASHSSPGRVYDLDGQTGMIRLALNAPVTMLPLNRARSRGGLALLEFASTPGQQVLLQRSRSGDNWTSLRTVSAWRESVLFLVSPPPSATGPFYRAIVIDRKF